MGLNSAIYTGRLRHRRFKPTGNAFSYSVCLFYLDLAEVEKIFAWPMLGIVSFRRRDYLGDPSQSLDSSVRDLVHKETGIRPAGPIRLLTQIAYFGYCFNPVSFYYCFSVDGKRVEYIVTEITNTPWHERHSYVLKCTNSEAQNFDFKKAFHVSPFMSMDQAYSWMFSEPGEKLLVNMKNSDSPAAPHMFDATLTVNRMPMTPLNFVWAVLLYPLMTFKTVAAIYFQALKLWMKRVPFYAHPSKGVSQ